MERLLGWYRVTSSAGAVAALIAANAIPLVGVLFLGWSVWNILALYWLENGIVGAINVLKIARAEGSDAADGGAAGPAANLATGSKAMLIPFFIVHYGIFWIGHGLFVLALPRFSGIFGASPWSDGSVDAFPSFDGTPFPDAGVAASGSGVDLGTLAFAAAALAISHALSFWWNFLRRREYLRVSPGRQMFAPYGRVFAMHVTIVVGAIAVLATGAPVLAVAVLVAAKTALDLGLHLAEHRGTTVPAG